jgi:hypothetical protein
MNCAIFYRVNGGALQVVTTDNGSPREFLESLAVALLSPSRSIACRVLISLRATIAGLASLRPRVSLPIARHPTG